MPPAWHPRKVTLLAVVLALCWGFGFYPFDWESPLRTINNGFTLSSADELRFNQPGIAFTSEAPAWLETAIERSTLRVDLLVRSAARRQSGPARILTVSRSTQLRNLTIGQEGTDLVIRLRTSVTDLNGLPPYRIRDIFIAPGWHRIELGIVPGRLHVYIDGHSTLSTSLPDNALAAWSPDYRLGLGNEFTYDRPWLGAIRQADVTVDGRTVSYTDRKRLTAPGQLHQFRAHYVIKPFIGKTFTSFYLSDFFINLFGFIPVGIMLMAAGNGRRSLFAVTLLAACLSGSIELGQLFLPGRVTETEDFILNTLGALIGGWLFTRYIGIRYGIPR